jgi:hypothetical protein
MVIFGDDAFLDFVDPFPSFIPIPKGLRRREFFQWQFALDRAGVYGSVMLQKAVAIGTVDKRDIEHTGIFQSLLHPGTYGMMIIFDFNDGKVEIGSVGKKVIRPFGTTSGDKLASHRDFASRKRKFFADLSM